MHFSCKVVVRHENVWLQFAYKHTSFDYVYYITYAREISFYNPQSGITKDNVQVRVSGNLYCQFVDAEKAAYGSKNPIYAVKQMAQSSMRAAIGELELDEILHARAKLNSIIKSSIQEYILRSWSLVKIGTKASQKKLFFNLNKKLKDKAC
jgi:regulator of protease activity HflC (stomatin/prohibitin superfamily)